MEHKNERRRLSVRGGSASAARREAWRTPHFNRAIAILIGRLARGNAAALCRVAEKLLTFFLRTEDAMLTGSRIFYQLHYSR